MVKSYPKGSTPRVYRKITKPSLCHPDKKHYAKGLCKSCYSRKAYGGLSLDERRSRHSPKDKNRASLANKMSRLWRSFGITLDQYHRMLAEQDGTCAICKNKETSRCYRTGRIRDLAVDHDHKTGLLRGLLCGKCNTGLGKLGDSVEGLERAVAYLRGHLGSSI